MKKFVLAFIAAIMIISFAATCLSYAAMAPAGTGTRSTDEVDPPLPPIIPPK